MLSQFPVAGVSAGEAAGVSMEASMTWMIMLAVLATTMLVLSMLGASRNFRRSREGRSHPGSASFWLADRSADDGRGGID